MDWLIGFFTPWIVFAGIFVLHLLLPARRVTGYVRDEDSGELLSYRLNGPLVLVACVGIWAALGFSGALPWDWLWQHRWPGLAGACTLGVLVSAAVVLSSPSRGGGLLAELYLGRRENPQMFKGWADAKMVLYLVGAILLQLNLLSFAAHHFLAYPDDPSPGVVLYVALFSWF
ncbi:MAG: ergosterol biosynthesis protein, partial [Gammaproteobacteria bacterium]|nr:ergosterol biosynthesis protein [Gammaproteobacteria bacterium]